MQHAVEENRKIPVNSGQTRPATITCLAVTTPRRANSPRGQSLRGIVATLRSMAVGRAYPKSTVWASTPLLCEKFRKEKKNRKEKSMRTMVAMIAIIARLQHSTVTVRVPEVL